MSTIIRSKEVTEIVPPSKAAMLMQPGILRLRGDAVELIMDWFTDGFLMHSIYLLPFHDRVRVFALLVDEDGNGIHILLNVIDPVDFDQLWDKHRNGADLLRAIVQDDILCDVILTHHDTFKVNRGLVDAPVWEYTL